MKGFVEGSIKGWYPCHDNKLADAAIMKDNSQMTPDSIKQTSEGIFYSGDSMKMGIGVMANDRMKDFHAKLVKAGVIPDSVDISQSHTTAFADKGLLLDLKPK